MPDNATPEPAQPVLDNSPAEPQADWAPPGGDEDFDSFFQRVGNDGESLADSNAIPAEPTTEPAEPAPAQTPASQPSKFELKTATGTVYKSPEDAVKGIEQKDQLINQLRSMVAAVTGEDPLSKSGIKPGQTPAPQKPVRYLEDRRRFAQDLTKAAEVGQSQDNWDPYGNVLGQYVYEIVQSAVGPYMPVVQNVGKQQAIEDITRDNPEFRKFYGSEEYQKVLEERPKLATYIQTLEGNPTMQEDLREMYISAWEHAQARKVPELVKQHQNPPTPTPRMPSQPVSRPSVQVPDQNRVAAQPNRPSLATSAGRRAIIEDAEAKGVADLQF
jgi:hypothetical protein